jgi:hypothetical protein
MSRERGINPVPELPGGCSARCISSERIIPHQIAETVRQVAKTLVGAEKEYPNFPDLELISTRFHRGYPTLP